MRALDLLRATPTVAGGIVRRLVSRPVLAGRVASAVDGAYFLDVPAPAVVIAVNDAGALGESVLATALPPRWARRVKVVRDISGGEKAVRAGLAAVVVNDPDTAAKLARQTRTALVPLGITGATAAMPPGHRVPVGGRPRVVVRAGRPLGGRAGGPEPTGAAVAAAVNRLLAEELVGWYGSLLPGAESVAGATDHGSRPPQRSWRTQWVATEPVDQRTRRPVWVPRR